MLPSQIRNCLTPFMHAHCTIIREMALDPVALLLLTLLAAAPLTYLLLVAVRNSNNKKKPPLPPSPPWGLPVLGHLHLLGALPHRSLTSLARRAHGGGPVMLLRLGPRVRAVVVSSPAAAAEVMKAHDLTFASRPRSAMAERLLYGGRDVAFAPYGERWRQARRVCVLHLLSHRRVHSFRGLREHEAAAMAARIRASSGGGEVVELGEMLTEYANAVVSRAAFGDESARGVLDGEFGSRGREVISDFQKLVGTVPVGELVPWLSWVDVVTGLEGKVRRTFQALDGLLEKVIDDHRRRRRVRGGGGGGGGDDDADRRDFVDVLLDFHENDQELGVRLDTDEIKAIILDMFAAGTDTTATAMEWAMAELVTHPAAMRRAQAEVRSASAGGVNEGHVARLPYLKAVVKETLRLHAPVPLLVPREPAADAEILGYRVPAGARVMVNAWAIGRDPATWHRADEFVPERFLGAAAAVDFRGQHLELVPFGAGRRMCPGIGFAEASAEMALATLLYHFDWEAAAGGELDMTEMNGLAVHIRSGLPLLAKPWAP